MSVVKIVQEGNGPKLSKDGSYIFTKEGIYFTLNEEQMRQLKNIINSLLKDKNDKSC